MLLCQGIEPALHGGQAALARSVRVKGFHVPALLRGIGQILEVSPDMAGGIDGAALVNRQVQRALRQAEKGERGEG